MIFLCLSVCLSRCLLMLTALGKVAYIVHISELGIYRTFRMKAAVGLVPGVIVLFPCEWSSLFTVA